MKHNFSKSILWIKDLSKKTIILSIVALMIVGGVVYAKVGNKAPETVVNASKGTIEEEVLVTGNTESRTTVNLGFERSGKVVSSPYKVGSKVAEGAMLASLDQGTLRANLQRADANLNQAEVELDSITRKSSLSDQTAEDTLIATIKDSYVKSDDAIHNKVDQFFKNPRGFDASFDPSFSDSGTTYLGGISDSTKSGISSERVQIESLLQNWEISIRTINSANLDSKVIEANSNLLKLRSFLDTVASAINSLPTTDFKYNVTIQGYKATIASARDEIIPAISSLIVSKDKYNNAPKSNGTTYEDVQIQNARIASLKADRSAIISDLSKTVLKAPISGVVTKMEAKRGEIINGGAPLITLISDQKLQIEANVSEVNISKVSIGNPVMVTFDAIPDETFEAKVVYIDPAAVVVDGVATYKITVGFADKQVSTEGARVRSGMTANLKIQTKQLADRIKVPAYAIYKKGDTSYVRVVLDKGTEEREVTTGARGKDGSVEIMRGISSGDKIVVTQTK